MKAAVAVALAALACGCAVHEVLPPATHGVEVPAQWSTPVLTAAPPAQPDWWRSFDDAALDTLVREALAANQDLALAAARMRQAEAQARATAAARRPTLDATAGVSRARQTLVGLPLPAGGFISDSVGVQLNAAWEADLWGRLQAGEHAAQAEAAAAGADARAARLSLAGQAARTYFALLAAQGQTQLAARTLALRESTRARVRRRYEAGLAPPVDLRLALASEAAAQALQAERARAEDSLRRQLETLLGRYPRGLLAGADALPDPPAAPAAGVPAGLLARRPDLLAAEWRIAAAGGRVEAARAALYPQLRLTGMVGRRASDVAGLSEPAANVWSLAADLLAPLIDGGQRRAQVDVARAVLAEALARYRQAVLDAFREVETALAADGRLAEQAAAAGRQLAQAEAAARLANDRYAAGLDGLLSVFEAERQRLDAAAQLLDARRERLQARVDLVLALGGGFDAH